MYEAPVVGEAGAVVLDALAVQEELRLVIPFEAKSGANVDAKQARKYAALTIRDVARSHTLPFRDGTMMPVFGFLAEHEERVRLGLSEAEIEPACLVIGPSKVSLDVPPGTPLGGFEVDVDGPPPGIVTIDADSSHEELQEVLLPQVVAAAARGEDGTTLATLLQSAVPTFQFTGRRARNQMLKKAFKALAAASKRDLADLFVVEPGGREIDVGIVRILRSPASFKPQGETQGWQAVRRRATKALRGKAPDQPSRQLTFEDLARAADSGENED